MLFPQPERFPFMSLFGSRGKPDKPEMKKATRMDGLLFGAVRLLLDVRPSETALYATNLHLLNAEHSGDLALAKATIQQLLDLPDCIIR
jgi:hypothetical protein